MSVAWDSLSIYGGITGDDILRILSGRAEGAEVVTAPRRLAVI